MMSEFEGHTPPWKWVLCADDGGRTLLEDASGICVIGSPYAHSISIDDDVAEAVANLPALLAERDSLRADIFRLVEIIERECDPLGSGMTTDDAIFVSHIQAEKNRAALKEIRDAG